MYTVLYSSTEWQNALVDHYMEKQSSITNDKTIGTLLVLEHSPVYTLGSSTGPNSGPFDRNNNLPQSKLWYDIVEVERGGQATYHGPGQLVLYPIIDLSFFEKDINSYLRGLEQVVINTAAEFEVFADRVDGLTGVWVGDKKISAIGK